MMSTIASAPAISGAIDVRGGRRTVGSPPAPGLRRSVKMCTERTPCRPFASRSRSNSAITSVPDARREVEHQLVGVLERGHQAEARARLALLRLERLRTVPFDRNFTTVSLSSEP